MYRNSVCKVQSFDDITFLTDMKSYIRKPYQKDGPLFEILSEINGYKYYKVKFDFEKYYKTVDQLQINQISFVKKFKKISKLIFDKDYQYSLYDNSRKIYNKNYKLSYHLTFSNLSIRGFYNWKKFMYKSCNYLNNILFKTQLADQLYYNKSSLLFRVSDRDKLKSDKNKSYRYLTDIKCDFDKFVYQKPNKILVDNITNNDFNSYKLNVCLPYERRYGKKYKKKFIVDYKTAHNEINQKLDFIISHIKNLGL